MQLSVKKTANTRQKKGESAAARHVDIETALGVSIGWGLPGWATLVCQLPRPLAFALLRGLDALARRFPTLADVIVIVGRPRAAERHETKRAA